METTVNVCHVDKTHESESEKIAFSNTSISDNFLGCINDLDHIKANQFDETKEASTRDNSSNILASSFEEKEEL